MYDIIIVGAGPAGLTAAIYARRAGKTVLVLEKETFGGQITFLHFCLKIPVFVIGIFRPLSVNFSNATDDNSSLTLCDPMNHSTPGLPVHHQLLEFTQTHIHRVGDAIQPSHPLSSSSPSALNPSQHQGLFQ